MTMRIWNNILDADRAARYFQRIADRYQWRQRIASFVLIALALSAGGVQLAELPGYVSALLFLGTAGISAWTLLSDYSGKAAAARAFSNQYEALTVEWKRLWYQETSHEAINDLQTRQLTAASGYAIPVDRELNAECAEETYAVIPTELAA